MDKEKIKKMIFERDFKKVRSIFLDYKYEKLVDLLIFSAWETKNNVVYDFVRYLLKEEKNKKRLIEYHLIASAVLTYAMLPSPFCYRRGFYHIRKAIKLDPEDISLKEHLLNIYGEPLARDFLSIKEAEKIAMEVLKNDPDNEEAKRTLEYIEERKK